MACAEVVDQELRNAVRNAQLQHYRCLKLCVEDPPRAAEDSSAAKGHLEDVEELHKQYKPRILKLAAAIQEEPNQPLDKEFTRCVTKQVEPQTPHLFLFRTDESENVEGCRWLLVSWLPLDAPDVKRAVYVRSRGLVAKLVPQPYFLSELFAKDLRHLTWSAARDQGMLFGGGVGKVYKDGVSLANLVDHAAIELIPGGKAIAPRETPVKWSDNSTHTMTSFGKKTELSIRISTSKEDLAARGRGATTFEVTSEDSKTPFALAQAGATHHLPSSNCYFAMHVKDAVYFVFWCPDATQKDVHRVTEDIRHAALKASVSQLVMEYCEGLSPKPRLVSVDARDPQDIIDGASGQPVGAGDRRRMTIRPQDADISNALGGLAFGVYGPERPQVKPAVALQSSLALPERPFPPWLGGSKAHTIVSSSGSSAQKSSHGDSHRHGRSSDARRPH